MLTSGSWPSGDLVYLMLIVHGQSDAMIARVTYVVAASQRWKECQLRSSCAEL